MLTGLKKPQPASKPLFDDDFFKTTGLIFADKKPDFPYISGVKLILVQGLHTINQI